ncbi:MAG: hypothetical protein K0R40_2443 [Burkholderiales bacterium]|jgi:hypothetical protein|nr:hypothetical protein [Burkholderiales bacterium]
MVPKDPLQMPFRWEFIPVENPSDKSVRWTWRAYAQTGVVALESDKSFETLTDCMQDAKGAGYGKR